MGGEFRIDSFELFLQALHMRIILFGNIEYKSPGTVQRFEISLDTRKLIGFLALIRGDMDIVSPGGSFCQQKGRKNLFVERILEGIIFNKIICLRFTVHILLKVEIPGYKLAVLCQVKEARYNVEFTVELTNERNGLITASLVLLIALRRVTICYQEPEPAKERNISPGYVLENRSLSYRVIIIFLLGCRIT
jgi:hypothetical protein